MTNDPLTNDQTELNNLVYSCVDHKYRGHEQLVTEHSMGYVISGEMHLQTNNGVVVLGEGTIGIIRRNQLAKSLKIPPPGGAFKSLNIFITQDFLRKYASENRITSSGKYTGPPMVQLSTDPFIRGYFDSLLPYFDHEKQPASALALLKTKEAVELLLQFSAGFKEFLFDFSEPYKIDLEAYMNQHYMFNIPTAQFARLTGRSLASFKRDFEKIFNTPPGQWLQQKRLSEAYYQIREKGRKPSDVYLDVGFENLSHFSYTFKKAFGVAPSMV